MTEKGKTQKDKERKRDKLGERDYECVYACFCVYKRKRQSRERERESEREIERERRVGGK